MRTLNNQELKTMESFFQASQSSLKKALTQYLKARYKRVISTRDYVIAVGDIPVALVAHLDTVFPYLPENIYYDRVKNVMWSPDGLGADDRAGVYAIVQILKYGYRPTIIFTTDEEKGCVGAGILSEQIKTAPTELKYIIQLDRRGSNDCVFYDCDNPDFEEYVESFGFVMNFGSFSDISAICPQWKVAGVNLSIGYYNEHSQTETLNIGQMFSTIYKVRNMLDRINEAKTYEYIESKYAYRSIWNFPTDEDGWDPSYGISKEDWKKFMGAGKETCLNCGIDDYSYNLIPVKMGGNHTEFVCPDCLPALKEDGLIGWCKICGEAFCIDGDDKDICEDCKNKEKSNK